LFIFIIEIGKLNLKNENPTNGLVSVERVMRPPNEHGLGGGQWNHLPGVQRYAPLCGRIVDGHQKACEKNFFQ
jgi:hypothetical protein